MQQLRCRTTSKITSVRSILNLLVSVSCYDSGGLHMVQPNGMVRYCTTWARIESCDGGVKDFSHPVKIEMLDGH